MTESEFSNSSQEMDSRIMIRQYRGILCFSLLPALLLPALFLTGCAKAKPAYPETFEVSGTVTADGEPLAGASVGFIPSGSTPGYNSFGTTDAQGKYTMQTTRPAPDFKVVPGVPAGTYKVLISKAAGGGIVGGEEGEVAEVDPAETIPRRYSAFMYTTLTAEIPQGGKDDVDFELKLLTK